MDPNFTSFGHYAASRSSQRSWFAALTASSGIYVAIIAAVVFLGSAAKVVREKSVDVTFVEKIAKPEPPPPPPPPVVPEVKPAPPPAAAPVVPKDMKIRKLDKPPPPKELVAPKEMP